MPPQMIVSYFTFQLVMLCGIIQFLEALPTEDMNLIYVV